MKKLYEKFTNQYSLSKVLRFSLIPQGKTKEYMEKEGIVEEDTKRADEYKVVKKLLDEYHKSFIDKALAITRLEGLNIYLDLYNKRERSEKEEKEFEEVKASLRKQVVKGLRDNPEFKGLFGSDIIKKYLPEYLKNDTDIKTVEEFNNFTTYFTGFHQNRKNMYTDEDKSTSIACRVITQNLPKFIDNLNIFKMLLSSEELIEKFKVLEKELAEYTKGKSLEDVFCIDHYNEVLTNKGIQFYNTILNGVVMADQKKIQGLNEYINLYNQKIGKSGRRYPKLKPLYKQILADREEISFIIEKFETDTEVLEAINLYCSDVLDEFRAPKVGVSLRSLLERIDDYDLDKIYIKNDNSLTKISKQMYGSWDVIQNALFMAYDTLYTGKIKSQEKYEEIRKKELRKRKELSIKELDADLTISNKVEVSIEEYFKTIGYKEDLLKKAEENYDQIKDFLSTEYPAEKQLKLDDTHIEMIKNLLDAFIELQHLIKMFAEPENNKDERFYSEIDRIERVLQGVTPLYNKVRNYITSKPYSIEKIKLNFKNPTLLAGWDKNKERDNTSVILLKNHKYYLGIMRKKANTLFLDEKIPDVKEKTNYQKMEYKLLPGPNKMLPKVFFSKSRIDEFKPTDEILNIREKESFKKGEKFSQKDCHELIDFFKSSIEKHDEWSKFDFHFSDTASYEDISGFYREIEQQNYKISFKTIPESYINQAVDRGDLYLFQIYNKDFSQYSSGRKNLHTIYWEMLFDQRNLENIVYKLNGEAEVFYRRASIPLKITHPANQPIKKKVPDKAGDYGESQFDHDIIKDKRYTVDKLQFHVPITLNYKAQGNTNINEAVNKTIHDSEKIYAIGIDRGERNLLYISVVDSEGHVVHQESLNVISENAQKQQDYHRLLDEREKARNAARKNWKSIENIKELKEGYLSQVIHKIAQLMVEYQAIVVLEDLNFGFMRGRQKVEKQVYQKFEKMLIDKLNYLIDKGKDVQEEGGALHAYQLTSEFVSFQKLGKQSGFLFYIPAWNTSKLDPTTGFVNLLYPKYQGVDETRKFFDKFDRIRYNPTEKYFEFSFDYDNFTDKAQGTQTKWTICSYGDRIENYRNPEKNGEWDSREVALTNAIGDLLAAYGIEYAMGQDIKSKIVDLENGDKQFYSQLIHLLKLILQIRNSVPNTDKDYLISPVKNAQDTFFCTKQTKNYLPENADANGAYNIARKGLWAVEKIRDTDSSELKKVKLAISNKEWMQYAQNHTVL